MHFSPGPAEAMSYVNEHLARHLPDGTFVTLILGMFDPDSGRLDGEQINYIQAIYDYGQAFVSAEAAWYDAPLPFSMSYRAVFEKGIIEYKNGILTLYHQSGETLVIDIHHEPINSQFNINEAGGYYNEIEYFLNCVKTNHSPEVITPQESVECLKLLEKLKNDA